MTSGAARRFNDVTELGPLQSEHPYDASISFMNILYLGGGTFVLAVFGLLGLSKLLDSDAVFVPLLLPVLVASVIGAVVWEVMRIRLHGSDGVAVYKHGFASETRGTVRIIQWQEVEATWQDVTNHYQNGMYIGTSYKYTVRPVEGEKVTLDGCLLKPAELGRAIQLGAFRMLLPKYAKDLADGKTVDFGLFGVSSKGIEYGQASLPWKEVDAIEVKRGTIAVKARDGQSTWTWAFDKLSSVPNVSVFYELVSHYAKIV
jgi:hypothetical protein